MLGSIALPIAGNQKDVVLERFLVHAEFACLSKPGITADVVAQKWLLVFVDITVLLEVLGEREFLGALRAGELALLNMGCEVAAQRKSGGVLLAAVLAVADVGLGNGHGL